MSLNPLKFFRKTEAAQIALVGPDFSTLELISMRLENDFAHDYVKDKAYGPIKNPPILIDGKKYYPCDKSTGAPLWLEVGENVVSCRTNPELIDRLIDRNLLSNVLQLDLSWTLTLIFGGFCGALGWAISASLYG